MGKKKRQQRLAKAKESAVKQQPSSSANKTPALRAVKINDPPYNHVAHDDSAGPVEDVHSGGQSSRVEILERNCNHVNPGVGHEQPANAEASAEDAPLILSDFQHLIPKPGRPLPPLPHEQGLHRVPSVFQGSAAHMMQMKSAELEQKKENPRKNLDQQAQLGGQEAENDPWAVEGDDGDTEVEEEIEDDHEDSTVDSNGDEVLLPGWDGTYEIMNCTLYPQATPSGEVHKIVCIHYFVKRWESSRAAGREAFQPPVLYIELAGGCSPFPCIKTRLTELFAFNPHCDIIFVDDKACRGPGEFNNVTYRRMHVMWERRENENVREALPRGGRLRPGPRRLYQVYKIGLVIINLHNMNAFKSFVKHRNPYTRMRVPYGQPDEPVRRKRELQILPFGMAIPPRMLNLDYTYLGLHNPSVPVTPQEYFDYTLKTTGMHLLPFSLLSTLSKQELIEVTKTGVEIVWGDIYPSTGVWKLPGTAWSSGTIFQLCHKTSEMLKKGGGSAKWMPWKGLKYKKYSLSEELEATMVELDIEINLFEEETEDVGDEEAKTGSPSESESDFEEEKEGEEGEEGEGGEDEGEQEREKKSEGYDEKEIDLDCKKKVDENGSKAGVDQPEAMKESRKDKPEPAGTEDVDNVTESFGKKQISEDTCKTSNQAEADKAESKSKGKEKVDSEEGKHEISQGRDNEEHLKEVTGKEGAFDKGEVGEEKPKNAVGMNSEKRRKKKRRQRR